MGEQTCYIYQLEERIVKNQIECHEHIASMETYLSRLRDEKRRLLEFVQAVEDGWRFGGLDYLLDGVDDNCAMSFDEAHAAIADIEPEPADDQ